jgi:hypothetical protein
MSEKQLNKNNGYFKKNGGGRGQGRSRISLNTLFI